MIASVNTSRYSYLDTLMGYMGVAETPSPSSSEIEHDDDVSSSESTVSKRLLLLDQEVKRRKCAEKRLRIISVQIGDLLRERMIDSRKQQRSITELATIETTEQSSIATGATTTKDIEDELWHIKAKCRLLRSRLNLAYETITLFRDQQEMALADAQSSAFAAYERTQELYVQLGQSRKSHRGAVQDRDRLQRLNVSQSKEIEKVHKTTVKPLRKRVQILEVALEQALQERNAFRTALQTAMQTYILEGEQRCTPAANTTVSVLACLPVIPRPGTEPSADSQ